MNRDNLYRDFTTLELEKALYRACQRVDAPTWVFDIIEEAISSEDWIWFRQWDGCTVIQDPTHPYVPCFIHDYLSRTGRGGRKNDRLFYHLQIIFGECKACSRARYFGARLGWIFWLFWKHQFNRNINEFTPMMLGAFKNTINK